MATYNIFDEFGDVIKTLESDSEYMQSHYLSWQYVEVLNPKPKSIISKADFFSRFSDNELVAIYSFARQDVQIEVYLARVNAQMEIDLASQRIKDGMDALAQMGVFSQNRIAEILAF